MQQCTADVAFVKRLEEIGSHTTARSGVHDLRHTAVTRMLEGGVPLPVVASLLGRSAATTVRMARRYGHIGNEAQLKAVELLERGA